jgi:thiol-disulfide isomerase/thioredoxin
LEEIPDPQPETAPAARRGGTSLVASLTSERAGRVVIGTNLIAGGLYFASSAAALFRGTTWNAQTLLFVAGGTIVPLTLSVLVLRGWTWPAWLFAIVGLAGSVASVVLEDEAARKGALVSLLASAAIIAWLALTILARRSGVTWPARVAMVLMTALLLARVPAGVREIEQNLNHTADRPLATRPLEALIGQPVPEFAFQRLDGTWVRADRPGTLYLVDVWTTWCSPCMSEMPELARLETDLENMPRFEMISVLGDPEDSAPDPVLRKLGLGPGDVARDPQRWMRRLGIGGYPTKLLVRDGKILLARAGGGRGAYAHWRGIIERELAAPAPGASPGGTPSAP